MAPVASTKIWKVFVARSPDERLKDAIESIDEALFQERERRKSESDRSRWTLTGNVPPPRESLILGIQKQLERLVPPAYRFEKGWQNMGFGYELVEMGR